MGGSCWLYSRHWVWLACGTHKWMCKKHLRANCYELNRGTLPPFIHGNPNLHSDGNTDVGQLRGCSVRKVKPLWINWCPYKMDWKCPLYRDPWWQCLQSPAQLAPSSQNGVTICPGHPNRTPRRHCICVRQAEFCMLKNTWMFNLRLGYRKDALLCRFYSLNLMHTTPSLMLVALF